MRLVWGSISPSHYLYVSCTTKQSVLTLYVQCELSSICDREQANPLGLRREILVLLLVAVLRQIPVLFVVVHILEPLRVVLEQVAPAHAAALSRRCLGVLRL